MDYTLKIISYFEPDNIEFFILFYVLSAQADLLSSLMELQYPVSLLSIPTYHHVSSRACG